MNNDCPTCGAVYNVAAKDIGRKLKCKKCSTALTVTEAGLVVDGPGAPPAPARSGPAPAAAGDEDFDDEPLVKKKKNKFERAPSSGVNPLVAIGGIPTILFAFGVFLVIVFTSLPIIGGAATRRANASVDKLKLEQNTKIKNLIPKGKKLSDLTSDEVKKYEDDQKKINDEYEKQLTEAALDAEKTKISNIRDEWLERYGQMFGFVFLSFGCLGYLRSEQPLTLRIVAAVILGAMMLIMFLTFGGGCSGRNPLA